jgi:hypothetical protein
MIATLLVVFLPTAASAQTTASREREMSGSDILPKSLRSIDFNAVREITSGFPSAGRSTATRNDWLNPRRATTPNFQAGSVRQ